MRVSDRFQCFDDNRPTSERRNKYIFSSLKFCGLIKGMSPKMCTLCVRVKINKRSFVPF